MSLHHVSKKRILPYLYMAAALLWGYNMYQVMWAVRASNPAEVGIPIRAARSELDDHKIAQSYVSDFRDPFVAAERGEAPSADRIENSTSRDETIVASPAMSLIGLVGETAILRLPTAETHVARSGDTVGEWRVVRVDPQGIMIAHGNQQVELELEN